MRNILPVSSLSRRWRPSGGGISGVEARLLLVQRLVSLICSLVWNVAAVGIALLVVALLLG